MILVYDGSFESYLTLVYDVYYEKIKVTSIEKSYPAQSLFMDEIRCIEYDEVKSLKVFDAIKKRFEKSHFDTIINVFMCDSVSFEMDLLSFIIMGFRDQKELCNINHSYVFNIQNLIKELFRVNHKMSGFVRFEELDEGTLYSKIDVKYNIVYFLGKHFFKRLNDQNYIIHDIKRGLAFIKNDDFVGVKEVSSFDIPTLSKDEEKFKKLWKTFFKSVAIESRENKKLQQQFVPLIYRTYMSEFSA